MAVYFIRPGNDAVVKIGIADNVEQRLRDLQGAHHLELRVARVLDGDERTERWLHQIYAPLKIRGEWFAWVDAMLEVSPPTFTDPEAPGTSTPSAIISLLGGPSLVAKSCGAPVNTVVNWKARNSVPARYHWHLLRMAQSLKTELTAEDLVKAHGRSAEAPV